MTRAEYLQIHKRYFSSEFKDKYNLNNKIHNEYIYIYIYIVG